MSDFQEHITRILAQFLEETFEKVQGIYLDQKTSLMETLASVSAETASQPLSAKGTSVVAHVWHLTFYLDLVVGGLRGKETGNVDWEETWKTTTASPSEWDAMQQHLKQTYQDIKALLAIPEVQESSGALSEVMAMLVHTAYHVGAIRQILMVVG